MSWKTVRIRPIDSVLFRDGRPFGTELGAQTAVSVPIPPPGTIAGFLRTLIGNRKGVDWDAVRNGYSEERVKGPLLQLNGKYVLPAPADAVVFEAEQEPQPCTSTHQTEGENVAARRQKSPTIAKARPHELENGQGCNMPCFDCGLQPLLLSGVDERRKPASGYDLWEWDALKEWLLDKQPRSLRKISFPPAERRVHVAINDTTLGSEESLLYTVEYRSYEMYDAERGCMNEWSLIAQVETDLGRVEGTGVLGGERRLAYVEQLDGSAWLTCPEEIRKALVKAQRVRMYLATPAVFICGWKPGWLRKEKRGDGHALVGSPPCVPQEVKLRLVAAAVPRRQAVSGWSLKQQGPKPVKWCVPAGAVYFFEVEEGNPALLAEHCWLESVSDGKAQNGNQHNGDRNRDAGYGLALWGIW